ncbi:hypothetical protein RRG08_055918 [Elysia crispata]|uniref:Uncharacterized protein n=1 Tax=Elysia crispata TaxID=231223 RepID=A0AAE1CSU7_9GAST|nr:hypothetical protein RRG08_055918 [Elysia crispata]
MYNAIANVGRSRISVRYLSPELCVQADKIVSSTPNLLEGRLVISLEGHYWTFKTRFDLDCKQHPGWSAQLRVRKMILLLSKVTGGLQLWLLHLSRCGTWVLNS